MPTAHAPAMPVNEDSRPIAAAAKPSADELATRAVADLAELRQRARTARPLFDPQSPIAFLDQLRRSDPQRLERLLVHTGSMPPWLATHMPWVLLIAAAAAIDASRTDEALARVQLPLAAFARSQAPEDVFGLVAAAVVAARAYAKNGRAQQMDELLAVATAAAERVASGGEPAASGARALLSLGRSKALLSLGQVAAALRALDPELRANTSEINRDIARQWAVVLFHAGQHGQAARALEESLHADRAHGDLLGQVQCMGYLAEIAGHFGDFAGVAKLSGMALPILRSFGHLAGEAHALQTLADCAYQQGRADEAAELSDRASALFRQSGEFAAEGNSFARAALARLTAGQITEAAATYQAALAKAQMLGHADLEHTALQGLGRCELALERPERATWYLLQADRVARNAGLVMAQPLTLQWLGTALLARESAISLTERQTFGEVLTEAHPHRCALAVLQQAAEGAAKVGQRAVRRDCNLLLAKGLHRGGDHERAFRLLLSAWQEREDDYRQAAGSEARKHEIRLQLAEARLQADEQRKKAEALDAELKERRELERELVRAREAAEAGNRAKSEFLAVLSHEIRTPLNAILGFADLLADDHLTADGHEAVATIARNGRLLLGLFEDLLLYSQLEHGKITLRQEPVGLLDAARQTLDSHLLAARNKGLAIELVILGQGNEWADAATLHTDPLRLQQVLGNLVGNAVKFTEAGGVTLELGLRRRGKNAWATIGVRDTGPGIAAKDMPHIFDAFTQADPSLTRRHAGAGLGLAVVQRLVTQLGGEVELHSELGRGSLFTVVLPLGLAGHVRAMPVAPADLSVQEPAKAWPLRILLADADPVDRAVGQLLLAKMGYSPHATDTGGATVREAIECQFDLVLLDMHLPGTHALGVAAALTADTAHKPFVVGMARDLRLFSAKHVKTRCDAWLPKPLTADRVLPVLRKAWQARHGDG